MLKVYSTHPVTDPPFPIRPVDRPAAADVAVLRIRGEGVPARAALAAGVPVYLCGAAARGRMPEDIAEHPLLRVERDMAPEDCLLFFAHARGWR